MEYYRTTTIAEHRRGGLFRVTCGISVHRMCLLNFAFAIHPLNAYKMSTSAHLRHKGLRFVRTDIQVSSVAQTMSVVRRGDQE